MAAPGPEAAIIRGERTDHPVAGFGEEPAAVVVGPERRFVFKPGHSRASRRIALRRMLARGIPAVLVRNVAPVFVRVGSFLAVARLGPHAGEWLIYATVQDVDLANANVRRVDAVLNQRSSTADRVVFGIGANVGFRIMMQKAGVRLLPSVACGSDHVMKDRCGPIGIFHRVWSAPYHLNGVLHDTPGA